MPSGTPNGEREYYCSLSLWGDAYIFVGGRTMQERLSKPGVRGNKLLKQ